VALRRKRGIESEEVERSLHRVRLRAGLIKALAIAALLLASEANAATTRVDVLACKDPADIRAIAGLKAKPDKKSSAEFEASRVASGECTHIRGKTVISIDERKPALMCVRPAGAFDCYWVASALVNEAGMPWRPPRSSCEMKRGAYFAC